MSLASVYDEDSSVQWKTGRGDGDGEFKHPAAIDVDGKGNVYICDSHNHRIQKFAPVSSR